MLGHPSVVMREFGVYVGFFHFDSCLLTSYFLVSLCSATAALCPPKCEIPANWAFITFPTFSIIDGSCYHQSAFTTFTACWCLEHCPLAAVWTFASSHSITPPTSHIYSICVLYITSYACQAQIAIPSIRRKSGTGVFFSGNRVIARKNAYHSTNHLSIHPSFTVADHELRL